MPSPWLKVGPQGPQGAAGAAGAQGAQGSTGPGIHPLWGATAAQASISDFFLEALEVGAASITVEARSQLTYSSACTLNKLYVTHIVANVDTFQYTVRINGVDTGITCQMASNGTSANNTANSAAVSAGDKVSLKTVQSSTTAGAAMRPRASIGYIP
jgi:hypothetical protein